MPNVIKIKNNGTAGVAPSSLVAGELALNRADGQLYYLNSSSNIAAVTDTIDGGVVQASAGILLNFNGSNNGTTFTHSGSSSPAITRVGSVVTSTAQVKYGSASGSFPGENNCLDIASDATFNLGSGDFCIEMWIYPLSLSGTPTLLRVGQSNATSAILFGHGTNLGCYVSSNGSSWDILSNQALSGVTTNAWHHVALTRSGSTFRGFVNGAVAFTVTSSASVYSVLTNARLGAANSGGQYAFNGYTDDFRVYKGAAVYTAAFTPPSAELTGSIATSRTQSIRVRGATAATLASVNPTPAAREPVYETDTRLLKIGDGTTAYASLGYVRPQVTATDRILGRSSAGAGVVEELTCTADARAILAASNVYAARAWVCFDGTATSNLSGTYSQSGTTVTVTATAHGLSVGQQIYSDITSGTGVDGAYTVATVPNANSFTYTAGTSLTTSGNVTLTRNTIRASGNVSSVADRGVGIYTINFTTAMSDVHYAAIATANSDLAAVTMAYEDGQLNTRTTQSLPLAVVNNAGTLVDRSRISVAVFR